MGITNATASSDSDGGASLEAIYPVGSIYTSTVSTNPADLFGFGTWVAFGAGRVLIGAGTGTDSNSTQQTFSAGNTGGEYSHTLSTGEMPSHSHSQSSHSHSFGSHSHSMSHGHSGSVSGGSHSHTVSTRKDNCDFQSGSAYTSWGVGNDGQSNDGTFTTNSASHSHTISIDSYSGSTGSASGSSGSATPTIYSSGSGYSHNNIQPYITVYMWNRTA